MTSAKLLINNLLFTTVQADDPLILDDGEDCKKL